MVSVVGLVFHDVGESLFFLDDVHPAEQARFDALSDHHVEGVDVAVHRCTHRHDLLVSTGEGDSSGRHLLVFRDLLAENNVNRVDDSGVFEVAVHDVPVVVEIVAVHVRVLISVCCRAWMQSIGCFPLVRHFVLVGVFQPGRRKVAFTENLRHLILLEIVHPVLVPITVAVGGVGRVQHVSRVGGHG